MASTTFVPGTVVASTWLNDVDEAVYEAAAGLAGSTARTAVSKFSDIVSILDFGADPTGVALCNTALDAAKAVCNTVYFPEGIYRIENYTLQDLRIVGVRSSGGNTGANEQTVIEGSGDLFVGANNFALEHLVIRNSSAGTRGKLITCAAIDTKLGPIIDVEFRKATYHIYAPTTAASMVDVTIRDSRFSDASIYSRYYLSNLFRYSEISCYTQANVKGLYIASTSSGLIADSVFEFQEDGAVYVENTTVSSDVIRGLKFQNIHFEGNGATTPTADVTVNVTLSLARIEFDSCGFYNPTVANAVALSTSPTLRLYHHNCKDISFTNLASTSVVASSAPKIAGETTGFNAVNGNIGTNSYMNAGAGFQSGGAMSVTISAVATTLEAMPAAGTGRILVVYDNTTEGAAVLLLTPTTVTTINTTLTSITFSVSGGNLQAATTGGASSRVLFWTKLST